MTEPELAEEIFYLIEGESPEIAARALSTVLAALDLSMNITNEQALANFARVVRKIRTGAEVH